MLFIDNFKKNFWIYDCLTLIQLLQSFNFRQESLADIIKRTYLCN